VLGLFVGPFMMAILFEWLRDNTSFNTNSSPDTDISSRANETNSASPGQPDNTN
jgi:hypothetical protein